MSDKLGYHLFLRAGPRTEIEARLDEAAQRAGLRLQGVRDTPHGERSYGDGSREPVEVAFEHGDVWTQCLVQAADRGLVEAYGLGRVEQFFVELSQGLGGILGRTFGDLFFSTINEREIREGLDCLDWLQYFGPSVAGRWGETVLVDGPFHKVTKVQGGAWVVTLGPGPFGEMRSKKLAADYLGIPLRPIYSKDSMGNRIEIAWR